MSKKLLSGLYLLWMAAFTIIPLALVAYHGSMDKTGAFTIANVMVTATAKYPRALWLSLGLSLISTVICLLLAYLLAITPRSRGIGRNNFVVLIFVLSMWMNFLLHILVWQTPLEKDGVINGILTVLHLLDQSLTNTPGVVILGMVYNFLPFMVSPTYNVLCKIGDNAINVTHNSGANLTQTLVHIWIPLSLPGIISGITTVFVPALITFAIPNLLGGSKILLIGNVIEQGFTKGSNWHPGSGLSLVLMVSVLISMAPIARYDKQGEGTAFR